MKFFLTKALLCLTILIGLFGCEININTPDTYDTLSIRVSETAKDYILNIDGMYANHVYQGDSAKLMLSRITASALPSQTPTYKKTQSHSNVSSDLDYLNLPSQLLTDADNSITGYFYEGTDNEYWAYFVEDTTASVSSSGIIYIDYN